MKRGNLLWVGSRMMLAEHRKLLNEINYYRKNRDDKKQLFDEQHLDEWQSLWNEAINNDFEVIIELANKSLENVIGRIVVCSLEEGFFYLQLRDGEREKIFISEINNLMIK